MLLPIHPVPLIPPPIRPGQLPISFLLIIHKISFVDFAIEILEDSKAIHFGVLPHAFVVPAVLPLILTLPLHEVILELSFVDSPIHKGQLSLSMFLSLREVA